jgi:AcrR family transcriptional regulator
MEGVAVSNWPTATGSGHIQQGTTRAPSPARSGQRTGRRTGETTSRHEILLAARELFAELGYDGTTVRAIARRAGVDPALIHHFFGNKDGVFHAAVQNAMPLADLGATLLEGGWDGLAERLLRGYLMLWEDGERGDAMAAIYRTALTHQAAQTQLDEIREELTADLAATIGGKDAKQRSALIGAQLHGLAVDRYIFRLPPLATLSLNQLVRLMTPAIETLLTSQDQARSQ